MNCNAILFRPPSNLHLRRFGDESVLFELIKLVARAGAASAERSIALARAAEVDELADAGFRADADDLFPDESLSKPDLSREPAVGGLSW